MQIISNIFEWIIIFDKSLNLWGAISIFFLFLWRFLTSYVAYCSNLTWFNVCSFLMQSINFQMFGWHAIICSLRQQVTKKCNTVEVNLNALPCEDLKEQLNGLLNYKEKHDNVSKKVLEEVRHNLTSDDDYEKAVSDEMNTCVAYDDSLTRVKSLTNSKLSYGSSLSPGQNSN